VADTHNELYRSWKIIDQAWKISRQHYVRGFATPGAILLAGVIPAVILSILNLLPEAPFNPSVLPNVARSDSLYLPEMPYGGDMVPSQIAVVATNSKQTLSLRGLKHHNAGEYTATTVPFRFTKSFNTSLIKFSQK
jgi:hypothetical protein